ncbi:MAG: hypothetical protein E5V81_05420 [Mesorhizobium sp.]|nr:MAG: hypothetical protein E5V81_05420 [Mesorhizobium sp.]
MTRKRLLMLLNWQSAALFLEHREGLHWRGWLAEAAGSEEESDGAESAADRFVSSRLFDTHAHL